MDKKQLLKLLEEEQQLYNISKSNKYEAWFRHMKNMSIWKAVRLFRQYEYRCARRDLSKNVIQRHWCVFLVKVADRKRNLACEKVGIELTPGMIGQNLRICHNNVAIYGHVGNDCVFHGNNVVGNKRTGQSQQIPQIGNRVDVGFGAIIIGDVTIADDCVIGAGAVVTKSFLKPGTVIAGVPAKEMQRG